MIKMKSDLWALVNVHKRNMPEEFWPDICKCSYQQIKLAKKMSWEFLCLFQTNLGVISESAGHIDSVKYFFKRGKKIARTRETREN